MKRTAAAESNASDINYHDAHPQDDEDVDDDAPGNETQAPADGLSDNQQPASTLSEDTVIYIKKGQRAYYRDHKQVKREVWQPGDGDGSYTTEVFHSGAHTGRYRFFQSHIGQIVVGRNEPPKHVVLDDQAAHEIAKSGVYSIKKLSQYWSHDFTATHGTIRVGRPNRGRPAVVPDGEGDMVCLPDGREVSIGWALTGPRKDNAKYNFYGEKGGYTRFEFPEHSAAEGRHAARATVHGPHSSRLTGPKPKPHEPVKQSIEVDNMPINVTGNDMDDPQDAPPGHKRPKISKFLYATPSPPVQLPNKLDYSSRHPEKRKAAAAFGEDNERPLSAAMRASIRGRVEPDINTVTSTDAADLAYAKAENEIVTLKTMLVTKDEEIARLKDEVDTLKSALAKYARTTLDTDGETMQENAE